MSDPTNPNSTLQDSRIDVAGIKAHPWFSRTMKPMYAESLAELQREQKVCLQHSYYYR